MAEETKPTENAAVPEFVRDEDFESRYANNIQFEWSRFDLKMIFGELDQSGPTVNTRQHTAITIPWIQVKLLAYYLKLYVSVFEFQNGKINIPEDLLPRNIEDPNEETKQNPKTLELYNLIKGLRDQFVSSL